MALAAGIAVGALLLPTAARRGEAMPTFAQAYGLDCKYCHSMVPALNAYGRYVQRTMYAGLDPSGYKKQFPFWISEQANYDSTSDSPKLQVGNLAVHAVAVSDNWTAHVQQWLVQNGDAGGLDTAWVSYNRLLGGNAHLVLGKMPGPGPSFWSMWNDVSGFAAPSIAVGEHVQSLASNRWGAKLSYGGSKFFGEVGYYGSSADLNGATQWGSTPDNGVDKGVQWHVAFERPDKPVSAGLVGNAGTVPLAEGGFDRYSAIGGYVQADPTAHLPGALFYYQSGRDANADGIGTAARSKAYSAAVYFPIFGKRESMLGIRREMTDDGLGTVTHTANINLGLRVLKYIHADVEAGLLNGSKPAWRYYLWWATPFFNNGRY